MDNNLNFVKEYIHSVTRRVKYYKDLGEKTFAQLNDQEIHFRNNEESNSIAIIVQHMTGNMLSRWTNFLTEDGEKEWRKRDDEFEYHNCTKAVMIENWQKGWDCFFKALESINEENLFNTITIRNEPLTVMDALNRQFAHYPYHVGQIVYIGKMVRDKGWKSLSIPKRYT